MKVPDAIMLGITACMAAVVSYILLLDLWGIDASAVRLDAILSASALGLLVLTA
jgi:hypothetical protein